MVSCGQGAAVGTVRRLRHEAGSSTRPRSAAEPIAAATVSSAAATATVSIVAATVAAAKVSSANRPPVRRYVMSIVKPREKVGGLECYPRAHATGCAELNRVELVGCVSVLLQAHLQRSPS